MSYSTSQNWPAGTIKRFVKTKKLFRAKGSSEVSKGDANPVLCLPMISNVAGPIWVRLSGFRK